MEKRSSVVYTFTDEQKQHLLEWANVLRTTDLPQVSLALRTASGMCCLGVYCHMKDANLWSWRKKEIRSPCVTVTVPL